jgi:hypothetical protein
VIVTVLGTGGVAYCDIQIAFFQFVQIEALISSVTDAYPKLRKHKRSVTALSCFIMFLGSLSCTTNVSTEKHFLLLYYLSVLNNDVEYLHTDF